MLGTGIRFPFFLFFIAFCWVDSQDIGVLFSCYSNWLALLYAKGIELLSVLPYSIVHGLGCFTDSRFSFAIGDYTISQSTHEGPLLAVLIV